MKYLQSIAFLLMMWTCALGQDEIKSRNLPDTDTITVPYPMPATGYNKLLKYLQVKVSDGDTLGKKHLIQLYNIRFRVDTNGNVDSTYIGINHDACPIHNVIAEELKNTKWVPAKKNGVPVSSEQELWGNLYLNKRIFKKYNCWPGFFLRLIF